MRSIPAVADEQFGVFTAAQAYRSGWTDHGLCHGVAAERLDRLRRGVFAERIDPRARTAASLRLVQHAVAASLTNRAVWISHLASGVVHGWDVWAPALRPCVTHSWAQRSSIAGIHTHRAPVRRPDAVARGLLRQTGAARTVVDIAREFGGEAGLVAADAALRRHHTDPAALSAAVDRATGRWGVAAARQVILLATGLAESVLESRSLWQLCQHGTPPSHQQVRIYGPDGRLISRGDFYWEQFGLVGEADGRLKYTEPTDLWREKRTEDAVRALGLGVVRWGWADLDNFATTAERIRRAGSEASYRGEQRARVVPARRAA